MVFQKIGTKLIISYIFILIAGILILGVLFADAAKRFLYEEKKRELLRKGEQIGLTITGLFDGRLQPETAEKILAVTGDSLGANIMVVNAQGKILAVTTGLRHCGLWMIQSDYQRVLSGQTVAKKGIFSFMDYETLFVATPIVQTKGQVEGGVFLFAPMSALGILMSGLKKIGIIAALTGILFALFLAVYLSRTITLPLIHLKDAAVNMAGGDFSIRVAERNDEIGELGRAFNTMAEILGQSMADLKREKAKIERMLADMSEGVLAVDPDNEIMFMNNKASELLKMAVENDWQQYQHLFPLRELASSVIRTGMANSEELKLPGKTWILGHASPLGEAENFWGAIIVLQDISELRKVENMRKQLIADLSHELRTPLTIIRGQTEALLDKVIDDERAKQEYLEGIRAETVRLGNMVRDLLEMARLDDNPGLLTQEDFNLKQLVYSVAGKYCKLAEEKQIRLETEWLSFTELVVVRADEGRIERVIRNFLDNALRYAKTTVVLRFKEEENRAVIEVEDDGPGIPEVEQSLVWERFYKVNKARTTGESGVGLGLPIAREIIHASGGSIWLMSKEGKGTVFGFALPKARNDLI